MAPGGRFIAEQYETRFKLCASGSGRWCRLPFVSCRSVSETTRASALPADMPGCPLRNTPFGGYCEQETEPNQWKSDYAGIPAHSPGRTSLDSQVIGLETQSVIRRTKADSGKGKSRRTNVWLRWGWWGRPWSGPVCRSQL